MSKLGTLSLQNRSEAGSLQPWRVGWKLTEKERKRFRRISLASREAKIRAFATKTLRFSALVHPTLDPSDLMPTRRRHGLVALSLFSGGGGLDLGFERAGYAHGGSWDIMNEAATTLNRNRPRWTVYGGQFGDVRSVDWRVWCGAADVVHGGPPCQPFSSAGRQRGSDDPRDMLQEFTRAVLSIRPAAFVMENVPAILHRKFSEHLVATVLRPLGRQYESIGPLVLRADLFGIPQVRRRVFWVGIRSKKAAWAFRPPEPTHLSDHLPNGAAANDHGGKLQRCMGVRQALGLNRQEFDALAPTIRSSLTGPRHTTSILSSVSALRLWQRLALWPNGVAPDRGAAATYPAPNGHRRLAVQDVALMQGFPDNWTFDGATYKILGQIGNAVPPPLAYRVACAVADAVLSNSRRTNSRSFAAGSP